ncbi:hypothetical protein [Cyanobium sp. Morenito 9A2]|uniref:hypothetical protein n=1 Tax=Cyanobium sp. Morenito 9A2 TaxID=2823718 RepID=UPI0020CDA023|nr:hypothetical protein [Cyanobium sp. Morenito 9A2]MCP9849917.1 hypothetical protein [Cyanobium sp. Morenito 9A2]
MASGVDPATWPPGPLSMATLLALEPASLRKLLKRGLRQGLERQDLASLLELEWHWKVDSSEALDLLAALEQRGWFRCDGDHWKTHLG